MTLIAHYAGDMSLPLLEGSVGDNLRRAAARYGDRDALAWGEGDGIARMTYATLLAEAERIAAWLLTHGAHGDRVAIWSRNSVEWALAEYGCALAGMVIASWNPGWSDHECGHALALTQPALVLAGHDTRGVSLLDRARSLAVDTPVAPLDQLRALTATVAPHDLPQVLPDDIFLIQFTSGTTGRAKGAAISHRAAVNAAWLRFVAIGADEEDIWLNPAPFSHVGGAITILLGAMTTGACYVVLSRFEPGAMLRLMRQVGATRIGGVPTMLFALLDHPDWTPGAFTLRGVGVGGAAVPQPLIERLTQGFGAPVLSAFGQSESPLITSSLPDDDTRLLAETAGRVAAHVELKIVDRVTGRPLLLGETGEVCVRGPCVMQGYHGMPEATAAAFDAEGYLRTGDLGSLDAQGYVRIHGRTREVIIRGGENIYPAEVEEALLGHPGVAAAAVIGVADERWGQQVGAAVVPRDGAQLTPEALEAHAATRLAHFKVPRRWRFVDSLPMTPSGKVRKMEVTGWFTPPE